MKVRIRLIEPMLGTAPKDPEVYKRWIESEGAAHFKRHPKETPPDDLNAESEAVDSRTPDDAADERAGWTAFRRDENGLFIFDYMAKGFFKEAANTLKDEPSLYTFAGGTRSPVKALRSKVSQCVFVQPRRIYFGLSDPDDVLERPLRAQTMQGPRVSLVRSDIIAAGHELEFNVVAIPHKDVKSWRTLLLKLLQFGAWNGLGQWRSGSYGRFEIVSIDDKPWEPTDDTRLDVIDELLDDADLKPETPA